MDNNLNFVKPSKFETSFRTARHKYFPVLSWMLLTTALLVGCTGNGKSKKSASVDENKSGAGQTITPIAFEEMNGDEPYNASGVVQLADSRFLFCDNRDGNALFELDLKNGGQEKGPLIRRQLHGLAPGTVSDLEDLTLVQENGRRYVFATSSLFVKKSKKELGPTVPPSGLLRVTIGPDETLTAENIPNFRDWFIQHAPDIAAAANLEPDDGGLNIEGLAWDPHRRALLFGIRTPLVEGKPIVIPVRVKNPAGSWTIDNLEMSPPIRLSIETEGDEQGIRSIAYIESFGSFLMVVGKSTSDSKAPFTLYQWDGKETGATKRLAVSFARKMKPEGLTEGKVGGQPALIFMDDAGGYQVVPLDKVRQ
jgi:hypothetical protein